MKAPRVSVLMPVWNQAAWVGAAIESVLAQTFGDFELIVADDGSTDGSLEKARSFQDDRITVLALPHRGCVPTLAEAASRARGEFWTRQDADDLSHRDRLRLQAGFLAGHVEYGLVGGDYRLIDAGGNPYRTMRTLLSDAWIRETFAVELPFCGPLVMVRAVSADLAGGFVDARLSAFEDPDLCWRVARQYPVANLPEIIYDYRRHPGNVSAQDWHRTTVRDRWKGIREELLRSGNLELPWAAGGPPSDPEAPSDPHAAERVAHYLALRYEVGFFYLESGQTERGRDLMRWACRHAGSRITAGRRACLAASYVAPNLAARARHWLDDRRKREF